MKKRIENARNMWGVVDEVLIKYEPVITIRPPFMRQVALLRNAITVMDRAALVKIKELEGIAEDKNMLELKAAEKADYVGNILQAYALDHEDHELYRAMMFSTYDIVDMRDTLGFDRMMDVYQKAYRLRNELMEYGLTTVDLDALEAAAQAFKAKTAAPRSAIVERSMATDDVDTAYHLAGKALHSMDKMIDTFTKESPALVAAYKKARIMVDLGGGGDSSAADDTEK